MSRIGHPRQTYAAAQNRVKALEGCLQAEYNMTTGQHFGDGGSYNLATVEMYIQALTDLDGELQHVIEHWENFLALAEKDDEKSEVEEAPVSEL